MERFFGAGLTNVSPGESPLPVVNPGTHYPLICQEIEQVTGMVTISPCEGVAARVVQLLSPDATKVHDDDSKSSAFYFRTSLNSDLDWQERPAP